MKPGLRRRLRFIAISVAGGTAIGVSCNFEQCWALALLGVLALALAAIAPFASPADWSLASSTAVVASGIAAWQLAAMWWVILAIHASSLSAQWVWSGVALGLLVGGQALCVAACWVPLAWFVRRRKALGLEAAVLGALCWLLAFGAASTLRQLSWAGDGYASLSTAAIDAPGLHAWLPVIGAQGVDGLLAVLAAMVALSLLSPTATLPMIGIVVVTLFAMSIPSLVPLAPSTQASGPSVHVTAIQSKAMKGVVWTTVERDHALDTLQRAINAAAPDSIVVTPETYIAEAPPPSPEGRWAELLGQVDQRGVHVLLGMPQLEHRDDGPHLINSVVQLSRGRQSVYAKERLVPGGEFLPWPGLMQSVYTQAFSGRVQSEGVATPELTRPFYVAGSELGMSICYEQAFAYTMAQRAAGSGWLANVSDDSWIGTAGYRNHMLATARLRAMELAKPLLRVTSGGRSVLIDLQGNVVAAARGLGDELLRVDVTPRTGLTPYARLWKIIAMAPVVLWALALVWLAMASRVLPVPQFTRESMT